MFGLISPKSISIAASYFGSFCNSTVLRKKNFCLVLRSVYVEFQIRSNCQPFSYSKIIFLVSHC